MDFWTLIVIVFSLATVLYIYHLLPEISAVGPVSVTKSVEPTRILDNGSAGVVVTISNPSAKNIENITLTETLPQIFIPQPKLIFNEANVLSQKVDFLRVGNAYSVSYSFGLTEDVKVPKNLSLSLVPSTVTYQIAGENKVYSLQSNPVKLSITGSPPAQTKQSSWPSWYYDIILLLSISFLFGVFGGWVNYYIGRPVKKEDVYTSSIDLSDRTENRYSLKISYDNIVSAGESCNVTYTCYRLDKTSATGDNVFYAYLTTSERGKKISSNFLPAGADQTDVKTGMFQLYVPKKGDYYLNIQERAMNTDVIRGVSIFAAERKAWVDMVAGGAAGLMTLLGLIGASALFTNEVLRVNAQTMITLTVSTFIAGFIPFQVIEKASGALKDKLRIASLEIGTAKGNELEERSKKEEALVRSSLGENQVKAMEEAKTKVNKSLKKLRPGVAALTDQGIPDINKVIEVPDPFQYLLNHYTLIPHIHISQKVKEAVRLMDEKAIDRIIVEDSRDEAKSPTLKYVLFYSRIEYTDLDKSIKDIVVKLNDLDRDLT